jgi:hypothetical protein
VQAPKAKFTNGKPPRPFSSIFSGQAAMQAPERWQRSTNSASSSAHGGLKGVRLPLKSADRNCDLLTEPTITGFTRHRHPQLNAQNARLAPLSP